ncbi:MFS transporter [Streptomyces californicus]|uniref:MFS transporter n=1 Tax=Streptomyces TaxID=1883 RepID=UPI00211D2F95|nr:MFS transporter [Streptomyces sp. sk226]
MRTWPASAVSRGVREPYAAVAATADRSGRASGRVLPVEEVDVRGPLFPSSTGSREGRDPAGTARGTLTCATTATRRPPPGPAAGFDPESGDHTMSLIRQRDFRFFWAAQTASTFGAHMSRVSLPLLAATTLAATPFQMGLLQAAQTIAFLVIGLPAGALVDRVRRRPILIACDALRALLLLCLVVGFALDRVDFTGLMTATLAIGFATAFYEIAYQSYIPAVVGRARLVEGNARLESTNAVARLAGPALGGSLVQLLGATLTVASQLVGHLVSALLVTRIRTVEERPPRGERLRMAAEIGGGLRFVLGRPVFRAITGSAATYNFFYAVMLPLMMLLLVEELGLSGAAVGALMAVAGLGGIVGAASAGRLARRFGQVRVVWLSYLVTVPTTLLMPLTHGGWGLALFAVPWFTVSCGIVVYNVGQVSIRQALCPPGLMGRMNAAVRFIVWGILALGSLTGGALGEWIGLRGGLLVAGAGMTAGVLWLLLSDLTGMRDLPADEPSAPRAADLPGSADAVKP